MLGDHFYHQRIRKAVAVFGSLFNDIKIIRNDAAGNVISQVKVPLSYAPKRDFLDRIDAMANGEDAERQIAVKLPRMSFEIVAMNYDATRQLPKINSCIVRGEKYDGTAQRLYSPVPYNISFQLSIFAKSQDDALQIVEQIIPYFTPHYTVTVKPLSDFDIKEDTPITLTGVAFSDDYEAPLEQRRTIIYTLDFDMKIQLYKGTMSNASIIEQATVNMMNLDGTELFSRIQTDSAFVASPLTGSTIEDTEFNSTNFRIKNLPSAPTSITVTQPSHGTSSASLDGVLTNINGVITAIGKWRYTPDPDYNGVDTFKLSVNGDFGSKTFDIGVTVGAVKDAINDTVEIIDGTLDFNVSTNDLFAAGNKVFSVAIGGEPTNGTVEVLDAATGLFRYTANPNFIGADQFTYRVTPEGGTSETGVVSITVSSVYGTETGDIIGTEDRTLLILE
jgi:hypothetical protein